MRHLDALRLSALKIGLAFVLPLIDPSVSAFGEVSSAGSSALCQSTFAGQTHFALSSRDLPSDLSKGSDEGETLEEYRQSGRMYFRTMMEYQTHLGAAFGEAVERLQHGDLVFNSGAGLAVADIEMARVKGVQVLAVNVDPMLSKWLSEVRTLLQSASSQDNSSIIVNSHLKNEIQAMSQALRMTVPMVPFSDADDGYQVRAADLRQIINKISFLLEREQLLYYPEYAQQALARLSPKIQNRVRLGIDNWGALAYSPRRHELLEQYYDTLAADGRFIVLRFGVMASGESRDFGGVVKTPNGDISIVDYLVSRYPDVFQATESTLIMKRSPSIQRLRISLKHQESWWVRQGSAHIPIDFYVSDQLP